MGSNVRFGTAKGTGTIPAGTPVISATCPNGTYVAAYWDGGDWVMLPAHDDARCRAMGCRPEPNEWVIPTGAPTFDYGYRVPLP